MSETQWKQFVQLFAEKNQHLTKQQVLQKAKKPFQQLKRYYNQKGGEIHVIIDEEAVPIKNIKELIKELNTNDSIEAIGLTEDVFSEQEIGLLSAALWENKTVKMFILNNCSFSEDSARSLAAAFSMNNSIETIQFINCWFHNIQAEKLLFNSLANNKSIKSMYFNGTLINIEQLAKALLNNNTVVYIDLGKENNNYENIYDKNASRKALRKLLTEKPYLTIEENEL